MISFYFFLFHFNVSNMKNRPKANVKTFVQIFIKQIFYKMENILKFINHRWFLKEFLSHYSKTVLWDSNYISLMCDWLHISHHIIQNTFEADFYRLLFCLPPFGNGEGRHLCQFAYKLNLMLKDVAEHKTILRICKVS